MKKKKYSSKMTILSDVESENFYKKYKSLVTYECRKILPLPGRDLSDLVQECMIKLLSVQHEFDENKSKEKTWVMVITRRLLFSIRKSEFSVEKMNAITNNGERKILRNLSLEGFNKDTDEEISFEEIYENPEDGRPSFSTNFPMPNDLIETKEIINLLEKRLPPEVAAYLKTRLSPSPDLLRILQSHEKDLLDLEKEGFKNLKRTGPFTIAKKILGFDFPKTEKIAIKVIANFFKEELGFEKDSILNRTRTLFLGEKL